MTAPPHGNFMPMSDFRYTEFRVMSEMRRKSQIPFVRKSRLKLENSEKGITWYSMDIFQEGDIVHFDLETRKGFGTITGRSANMIIADDPPAKPLSEGSLTDLRDWRFCWMSKPNGDAPSVPKSKVYRATASEALAEHDRMSEKKFPYLMFWDPIQRDEQTVHGEYLVSLLSQDQKASISSILAYSEAVDKLRERCAANT